MSARFGNGGSRHRVFPRHDKPHSPASVSRPSSSRNHDAASRSAQTVTPILLGFVFNVTGAWRTLPVYSMILTVLSFCVFTALVKNIKAHKVENVVGLEALDGD